MNPEIKLRLMQSYLEWSKANAADIALYLKEQQVILDANYTMCLYTFIPSIFIVLICLALDRTVNIYHRFYNVYSFFYSTSLITAIVSIAGIFVNWAITPSLSGIRP